MFGPHELTFEYGTLGMTSFASASNSEGVFPVSG